MALRVYENDIRESWPRVPFAVAPGQHYRVRVEQEHLDAVDAFHLVANGIPGASAEMGRYTSVVAGAEFADGAPGFYVLAARSGEIKSAGGNLLDYHRLDAGP